MEKNSAASLLTSVDSLFTTQEERDIATQPRVQEIPIDQIAVLWQGLFFERNYHANCNQTMYFTPFDPDADG